MEDLSAAASKPRVRILALHGTQANNEITRMQLENLNITKEDYDIIYLRGTIQEHQGHPDLETIIDGPFYSWIDESSDHAKETSIREAVINVLSVLNDLGPFDGIFGFSTGALIAAIVANMTHDQRLKMNYVYGGGESNVAGDRIVSSRGIQNNFSQDKNNIKYRSMRLAARNLSFNGDSDEEMDCASSSTSLKFVVLACATAPFINMGELRRITKCRRSFFPGSNKKTASFHIIATEDSNKTKSEDWAMIFSNRHLMYISSVHGVGRAQRNDHELTDNLSRFITSVGVGHHLHAHLFLPEFKPVSKTSSISVLPLQQVSLVRLVESRLPGGRLMDTRGGEDVGANIVSLLKSQPREKPFLYNAREKGLFTSYGQLSDFILGAGKLSSLGVQKNEVVAYGCPVGASALAAVAFLTIAFGAVAAPLAPNTSEADTLDTLEQFNAKYLIIFEGVECPEVNAAFQKYSSRGKAKIILAYVPSSEDTTPGIFAYGKRPSMPKLRTSSRPRSSSPARNKLLSFSRSKDKISWNVQPSSNVSSEQPFENDNCLLLRTSGTTSNPKGVPLTQHALIRNATILAASLGLEDYDVCYSVMPLFHIGGLSASILCTLASGGSVCCESMNFHPERMVEALATSDPKPTWYSSVPTIHNATVSFIKTIAKNIPDHGASLEGITDPNKYAGYGISRDGTWVPAKKNAGKGHRLRFIRSGAAELSNTDGLELSKTYGGIPIIPTYSMSEQMPITQPPVGKHDMIVDKPGSVGVSVSASIAIVNGSLRPLAYGEVGELAICGSTVMTQYLENLDADRKSFFYLPLDIVGSPEEIMGRYFLTGDTGTMDSDGFITLSGRTKELIKKGGEQISPFEVEGVLLKHDWVKKAICFSVPSKLYGETVGAALILSEASPTQIQLNEIILEMRTWMKKCKFDPLKWPMRWKIVIDEELPKTKTKKYIRIGLSKVLGLDEESELVSSVQSLNSPGKKASIDYEVLSGLRFFLACYVMFMHIGSNDSWGNFSNLRRMPWHVHTFFLLAGYIMASPMTPEIQYKFKFVVARIRSMYTLYFLAVLFGLGNLLVSCRPSTFSDDFTWHSKPDDLFSSSELGHRSELFCEGTPLFPSSYWINLILTILSHLTGLTITPFWGLHWWLGYYLWFIAMYNQCLMIFPVAYNYLLTRRRKQGRFLVGLVATLVVASVAIVMAIWFAARNFEGYRANYSEDGKSNRTDSNEWFPNAFVVGFYLFAPFWMVYFVIGIVLAFVYDAYRPNETHRAKQYGYIADICTVTILAFIIVQISQGSANATRNWFFRPSEANNPYLDIATINRLWDNIYGRLFCPITTLWIYALSTGEGTTARFLRNKIMVSVLAPNSYGCFLFHQMIGQWYFAATRSGAWYNWWNYRKAMYWFSPEALPVEWYEYPYVVGLVVVFTRFMTMHVEPHVSRLFVRTGGKGDDGYSEDQSSSDLMLAVVRILTGVEATMNSTLEECGLSSIGMPIVVSTLNALLTKKHEDAVVNVSEMIQARSISDMVAAIDTAKARSSDNGI